MSSLTNRLFDKLLKQEKIIEVDGVLKYMNDIDRGSEEYQQVVGASKDSVDRTIKLKALVLKSYRDGKLKDLDFFKYLAWSGQGELCRLIGYGDKQIAKLKDRPEHLRSKPHIIGTSAVEDMEETDQGVLYVFVCVCVCVYVYVWCV